MRTGLYSAAFLAVFGTACVPQETEKPQPYIPQKNDPRPLSIEAVTTSVSARSARITFRTSEAATAKVEFGVDDFNREATSAEPVTDHAIDLKGLAEGNYKYRVTAAAGERTTTSDNAGEGYTFRVARAPVISNVNAVVAGNDVTVTWQTDLAATSLVEAGFSAYDLVSLGDSNLVSEHSIVLTVATPGKYKFRVVSIDADGDMASDDNASNGYSFEIIAQPTQPLGTMANPIVINVASLPMSYTDNTRSTVSSPSNAIDKYTPATQNEKGPEYIYRFTLTQPATMAANLSMVAPVDIDIHLLSALDPSSRTQTLLGSLASMRHNSSLTVALAAGTYYLVADTFGTDSSKAGAYSLNVQLSAQSGACVESTRPTPNGIPVEVDNQNGCPRGMLPMSGGFCIDQYEAMLVGIDASGSAFDWSPFSNPGSQKVKALSVAGKVPQGYINKTQAKAACLNAGKRLCSMTEWMTACQGPQTFTYPYGNTRQPGVCNDARAKHPAVELFPNDPNPFSKIQHPCINQLPNSLDRTGDNPGCESAEGPLDMMGNLHEWIEDKTAGGNGIFKGGYYVDTVVNGNGCLYKTTAHNESHWDYSTGFRCCAAMLP